jgi:hypothetical protein
MRHHRPQLRNLDPGDDIDFKWRCMWSDRITESVRVDRCARSLNDAERPQEKCEGNVQRTVCEVQAGAYTFNAK